MPNCGGEGCGYYERGTGVKSLRSPGRSGTGLLSEPRGKYRLRALREGLLWPEHQAVREAELANEARPENSPWLKSYHVEDGGGAHSRSRSTRARAGTRGKGAPAVLDLLSPLTETAAALPLAKEIWA